MERLASERASVAPNLFEISRSSSSFVLISSKTKKAGRAAGDPDPPCGISKAARPRDPEDCFEGPAPTERSERPPLSSHERPRAVPAGGSGSSAARPSLFGSPPGDGQVSLPRPG